MIFIIGPSTSAPDFEPAAAESEGTDESTELAAMVDCPG